MEARHSQRILDQLYEYDSFLDSLKVIADMGCGSGEDITWWAKLTTRDTPPVPHNYRCFAIDKDAGKLNAIPNLPNIVKLQTDFNKPVVPIPIDLMWAHDSLQYSINPLDTLRVWNEQMNYNGMLVLCVQQHSGVENNRYYSRAHNGCYHHFTPVNLLYMLAVNGFDCRDAYLLKQFGDPWIHVAVYKSGIAPMDPATTTWADLVETGLLHPTVVNSVTKYGYLRQEDVLYPWLDRENYFIDYISEWTEIPKEAVKTTEGVFNTTKESATSTIKQAKKTQVRTKLAEPVGVLRPPKKTYD